MSDLFPAPPREVCILRLSAIGDVCHALPVVRTLQQAWPQTRFTWVIGRIEAKLLGAIPDIEFIVFDKQRGLGGALGSYGQLRREMRRRRFDLLLHMQVSLRASLASALIPAPVKLGFDRARARELQWWFTTHRIRPAARQHVMDGLFGFAESLGVYERLLRWDIPVSADAAEYARRLIPDDTPTLVISPCASHGLRNWRPEYYAQVADYAATSFGMEILLCGARSEQERRMGVAISSHMKVPPRNLIGQDTLPQLYATLQRASLLLSPDSGPVHMATAAGTPVIGLYAATNPSRSGPYLSRQWCVDKYAAAARKFLRKTAAEIPWTTKIERPGVMDLITPDDVMKKLSAYMLTAARRRSAAR
jgi:heptosyltransferase I